MKEITISKSQFKILPSATDNHNLWSVSFTRFYLTETAWGEKMFDKILTLFCPSFKR